MLPLRLLQAHYWYGLALLQRKQYYEAVRQLEKVDLVYNILHLLFKHLELVVYKKTCIIK